MHLEEMGVRSDQLDHILTFLFLKQDGLSQLFEAVMDEGVIDLEGVVATTEADSPVFVVYHIMVLGVVILEDRKT